jgi:hypothetical protein
MELTQVEFPLFKMRAFNSIEKSPLGLVKVHTVKGTYILDDLSINDSFIQRRIKLAQANPGKKIYSLSERVSYLRQLVKYKSGSIFVDYNGNLINYRKSSKLYNVTSHKIVNKTKRDNWTIIHLVDIEIPFLVALSSTSKATHASIMDTQWGPFLYDLTSEPHAPFKRKI